MILVTGANGGLGKATVVALKKLKSDIQVRAMVRDLEQSDQLRELGAEAVFGDYFDYDSMRIAFNGVDDLLLISAPAFTDRETQQRNAIKAAVEAGVKRIIYTSIQHVDANPFRIPMVTETEIITKDLIRKSGIPYIIVNNTLYADALEYFLGPNILTEGIAISSGEGKGAFVKRDDNAEGLARLLLTRRHINEEVDFSNIESWSGKDIAAIFTELHGSTVPFLNNTREQYIKTLAGSGLPENAAEFSADWAEAIKQGEMESPDVVLANLLGREPEPLKNILKEVYQKLIA